MKIKIAALFPGQGSQTVGMAKPLIDNFTFTKAFYEEASDAIGENLLKWCLEGPAETLELTMNQQPSILTTSYAWFQVLKRQFDFTPAMTAGHSLGEYTALLASGAMTLTEAVKLVRKRGELMQTAVPAGKGAMAALLGLDAEQAFTLCKAATESPEHSVVVPANLNAPGQIVISGHAGAVTKACELASNGTLEGIKARKAIPLKVSAPFHSPLMKPAADNFKPFLAATAWKGRTYPVCHNVDAKLRQDGDLVTLLTDQIHQPVRWIECVQTLSGAGATAFVEMGPGRVLSGLGKRIQADAKWMNVESADDVKAFEAYFKENA